MTYGDARHWLKSVQKMRIMVAQDEEQLAEIREKMIGGAAYIGESQEFAEEIRRYGEDD